MNKEKRKCEFNLDLSKRCKTIDELKTPEEALEIIKLNFPIEIFNNKLPAIILKHQLYALIEDKTLVDKKVHLLIEEGILRSFSIDSPDRIKDVALVYTSEYKEKIRALVTSPLYSKFIKIIDSNQNNKLTKNELSNTYLLNEFNIKNLVKLGFLILNNVDYLLSIPNFGEYVKYLFSSRKVFLNIIKKSKFKEILKSSLENRKLPFEIKLPLNYHIWDIIGRNDVETINSPTGIILRYRPF